VQRGIGVSGGPRRTGRQRDQPGLGGRRDSAGPRMRRNFRNEVRRLNFSGQIDICYCKSVRSEEGGYRLIETVTNRPQATARKRNYFPLRQLGGIDLRGAHPESDAEGRGEVSGGNEGSRGGPAAGNGGTIT